MAQAKQDMGTGSIKKLMLQLMIPAVVAQVVNLLYNIVDRIYIGHIAGIGAAALTGVGLFTPILMLLNAFAMLVGAGGAPRTAIALGQGDRQQAEKIVSNSFTVLMFFAVVLTIGFYAGAPVLLRLFGASDATLPYALSYIGASARDGRQPAAARKAQHQCGGSGQRSKALPQAFLRRVYFFFFPVFHVVFSFC